MSNVPHPCSKSSSYNVHPGESNQTLRLPLDSCPASEIHSCAGAFFNLDIAIDGAVSEALAQTAGRGPLPFQPVDLHMRTNSQNQSWVVRREITASAYFESVP